MPQPYKLFTIYAREDAQYLEELRGQLRPLEIAGRIKIWSDREINPGVDWEQEIVNNLDTADIILILVSAAYYNSAYIHNKEINYAISRHEKGDAKVLPVILRPCHFLDDPVISRLQVLPTDGKAVTDRRHWQERDDAWLDVVAGVKRTVDVLSTAENRR
ncbi:MAG: toll/interleukin-1 receptor domain-containing protein, partial [Saprospiraceae bacterium]|nr:toll/interleukin-1 receptor domain-containing protein [Saprospiraceae bacterium]